MGTRKAPPEVIQISFMVMVEDGRPKLIKLVLDAKVYKKLLNSLEPNIPSQMVLPISRN